MVSTASIKAKLITIAKERGIEAQNLLNKLGEERFLARLAASPWVDRIIFKGGSLLPHLVETSRRTRDIDFSVRNIDNKLENLLNIVHEITSIDLDDAFVFRKPRGERLEHTRLPYPGARIKIDFSLGKARGSIWLDLALCDDVEPVDQVLRVLRYRNKPLLGKDIHLLAYPPEFLFAEKFQTAVLLGAANSRMKDFYDLVKLIDSGSLRRAKLNDALDRTFNKRKTPRKGQLEFSAEDMDMFKGAWATFVRKWGLDDITDDFSLVINKLNDFLTAIS